MEFNNFFSFLIGSLGDGCGNLTDDGQGFNSVKKMCGRRRSVKFFPVFLSFVTEMDFFNKSKSDMKKLFVSFLPAKKVVHSA